MLMLWPCSGSRPKVRAMASSSAVALSQPTKRARLFRPCDRLGHTFLTRLKISMSISSNSKHSLCTASLPTLARFVNTQIFAVTIVSNLTTLCRWRESTRARSKSCASLALQPWLLLPRLQSLIVQRVSLLRLSRNCATRPAYKTTTRFRVSTLGSFSRTQKSVCCHRHPKTMCSSTWRVSLTSPSAVGWNTFLVPSLETKPSFLGGRMIANKKPRLLLVS